MPDDAVVRTITVLVIACPHALGLAIPLVVSIATERAARAGVLVKDRLALESMRTVDTVLFDKTGTLTKGTPAVTGIEPAEPSTSADELLALAAAAEADSEHPLARAIVNAAQAQGPHRPRLHRLRVLPRCRGARPRQRADGPGRRPVHARAGARRRAARRRRSGGTRARSSCTCSSTGRSPARCAWRTRSAPSRGKPSPLCTSAACRS